VIPIEAKYRQTAVEMKPIPEYAYGHDPEKEARMAEQEKFR